MKTPLHLAGPSIGPLHIYRELAMLTYYTPYWRKVARMLSTVRRLHRPLSKPGEDRWFDYIQSAFKDTRLPDRIRIELASCLSKEFEINRELILKA